MLEWGKGNHKCGTNIIDLLFSYYNVKTRLDTFILFILLVICVTE